MSGPMRIAAAQLCSGTSPDQNLEVITKLAGEAAQAGADYLLTPEVSVAFARDVDELKRVALPYEGNPAIAHCAGLARRNGLFLHLGSLAIALEGGRFANRSVLFDPDGEVVAHYDKIHLFDADPPDDRPYRESDTYAAGDQAVVAAAAGFGLGLSICYDVRFPKLYSALVGAGAEVLAVPAAFTVPTGEAHWEVLLRARAIETGSYVIAAAQGGKHQNGRKTWGRSMIVDPWGRIIAKKDEDGPGIIVAEFTAQNVTDARARIPALANRREFSLSVNYSLPE